MDSDLRNILVSVHGDSIDNQYTHISISGSTDASVRQWNIKDSETFWIKYCDLVMNSVQEPITNIYIAEKHENYMPVIAELTIKYDNDGDGFEPYDENFLRLVCYTFQQSIKDKFVVADMHQICVILESENFIDKDTNLMCYNIRF